MKPSRTLALSLALALPALAAPAGTVETSAGALTVTRVAEGFDEPWAVGFLPGGGLLVTERAGRLVHIAADGARLAVAGLPAVATGGQGGLLDLVVARDFAATRELFLSFSIPQDGGGAGTALAVARLSEDGARLEDVRVLFQSAPGFSGGRHFGSRIAEGPEGHLFLTIGDRGADASAQDNANHNGTVVRLNRDGSVPADNPFVGSAEAQPEIWSYGHRNAQGMAFDAEGRLWLSEHGARGGDEINLVEPGLNYGWPVIAYGTQYSGGPIGIGTEAPGMEQPALYWDPSMAPSGTAVLSGSQWPEWDGSILVGSLQFDYIARVDPAAGFAEEELRAPEMRRVRDVRQGPDGAIWFLSVREGALFRIDRADSS